MSKSIPTVFQRVTDMKHELSGRIILAFVAGRELSTLDLLRNTKSLKRTLSTTGFRSFFKK